MIFCYGQRMCSIMSMERYIVRGHVGLIEVCSCLSMFIIISCKYLLYCSGCLSILSFIITAFSPGSYFTYLFWLGG
jgi:hypothetical protein